MKAEGGRIKDEGLTAATHFIIFSTSKDEAQQERSNIDGITFILYPSAFILIP